ncbi:hypothetical protein VTJ49DRAFT_3532 [Mycothermus thermophilus]|uniref:Uncharacterized protein n=1 Tax=Humicola insolens TaxID=85995 RepID=A0ABR3V7H7_HUMIN
MRTRLSSVFLPRTSISSRARRQLLSRSSIPRLVRHPLAVYIFTPTQCQNPKCKQCSSFQSRGPASDCRVPITNKHGAGACTNCYYSGQSTACSLRIGMLFSLFVGFV